jgi:hypothetical protein
MEKDTNISELISFLRKTVDGRFTLSISVLFWILGIYEIAYGKKGYFEIAIFFLMPILLIITMVRHRIGTPIDDPAPIVPCIISVFSMAIFPLYFIFWR